MGDPPVPSGHWPDGRSKLTLCNFITHVRQSVARRSGRRVANRHRHVAYATLRGTLNPQIRQHIADRIDNLHQLRMRLLKTIH